MSERGYCRIILVARAIARVTGIIRNILYYCHPGQPSHIQHTLQQHAQQNKEAELRAESSCWFELVKRQRTFHNDLQGHLTVCCQLCRPNLHPSTS